MVTRVGGRGAMAVVRATLLVLAGHATAAVAFKGYTRDMVVRLYADPMLDTRILQSKTTLTSTTTASFGLGFSEFYGAGGSAVLQGGAKTQTAVNSLYPGFGATGDWVTQPQMSIKFKLEQKVTVIVEDNTLEMVLSKLWASSILRDNMVTVFGYILHLPDNPLPADLYTSLFYIYTDVRFRRVQTVEMVRCLPKMSFESAHGQFLILFRELRKVCPKYLSGAVEVWLEALQKQTINIDKLLRQGKEPVTVDFLAGIEPSVMPVLEREIIFHPEAERAATETSRALVGKTLSLVLGAVAAEVLPLTQPLFALILLHRPVNDMIPQREETERYIIDALRFNNVEDWEEVRQSIRGELKNGAYAVGRATLLKISTMKSVDTLIRMKARYTLQYMKLPIATYANPDYEVSSQILSTPAVNILLILKAITENEYPKEVIAIRDRLEYYIRKGYIDTEFIIKGFNRFDHVRPVNILIALLTRIEVRIPNLPREIMSCVKYLKQVLIYKKYLSNLNPMVPLYFVDVEAIRNGFSGPFMPRYVLKTVKKLIESLTYESLPWARAIQTMTVQDCSLPRLCLLNVFRKVVTTGQVKDKRLETTIIKLVKMLDYKGDPLPIYIIGIDVIKLTIDRITGKRRPMVQKGKRGLKVTESEDLDLQKISVSSSYGSVHEDIIKYSNYSRNELLTHFSKAEQPELLYFPSKTVVVNVKHFYPGPNVKIVFTPIPEEVEMEVVVDIKSVHTIIPQTRVGTTEDIMLRPIRLFLSHPKLYEFLGPDFKPETYKYKGLLLRAVLKRSLTIKCVQFNKVLHSTITKYLQFLESQSSLKVILDERVPFPKISVTFLKQVPDYNNLVSLIPMVKVGTPQHSKIKPILEILSDKLLLKWLGPGFVLTNYRTRGELLIETLFRATQLNYIRADSVRMMAITRFIEHVEDSLIPREIVLKAPFPELSVVFENEPAPQLSIEGVLPVTIPGTAIHVRLRPLRKFLSRPDIKVILSGLKLTVYRKKGELLRAIIKHSLTLKLVISNAQLHAVVKDYWAYLSTKVKTEIETTTKITINHETIIHALPPPKTESERKMLYIMKDYMSRAEFHAKIATVINFKEHRTRGIALKVIFERLTMTEAILGNQTVYKCFMYYKTKVQMHGYGAQALDLVVSRKTSKKFRFEVYSLFRAVDHDRLSATVKQSVARIIRFFTINFQPSIYLADFQYSKYKTKGTFLQALLQTLLVQGTVRPEIKADIIYVFPYIITTGPGAERIDFEPNGTGSNAHVIYL